MTRPLTAYAAGYACGKSGPNTINCHFSHFSSPEKTRDWARGKRDAEAEKADRSPWFPIYIHPERPGWFECQCGNKIERWFWNGADWHVRPDHPQLVWPLPEAWRGLAKRP